MTKKTIPSSTWKMVKRIKMRRATLTSCQVVRSIKQWQWLTLSPTNNREVISKFSTTRGKGTLSFRVVGSTVAAFVKAKSFKMIVANSLLSERSKNYLNIVGIILKVALLSMRTKTIVNLST